jgi:hypothetical protein
MTKIDDNGVLRLRRARDQKQSDGHDGGDKFDFHGNPPLRHVLFLARQL